MEYTTKIKKVEDVKTTFKQGNFYIDESEELVVVCTEAREGDYFDGTIIHDPKHNEVGVYVSNFNKSKFTQFLGEITIKSV